MTAIRKDIRGNWRAETNIPLPNNHRLDIVTSKVHSGSVVSTASVVIVEGSFVTHRVHQDFYKRISIVAYPRTTAKCVEGQHRDALTTLPVLLQEVQAQYQFESDITLATE